jgi:hypothetical protein
LRRAVGRGCPADGCSHTRQQFIYVKRLGHIVVRARIQRLHLVSAVGPAGQNDDRCRGPAPEPSDDLHPIQIRQPKVEDDQIRRVTPSDLKRLGARGRRVHLITAYPQVDLQRAQDLRLVVDDQDAAHKLQVATTMGQHSVRYQDVGTVPAGHHRNRRNLMHTPSIR